MKNHASIRLPSGLDAEGRKRSHSTQRWSGSSTAGRLRPQALVGLLGLLFASAVSGQQSVERPIPRAELPEGEAQALLDLALSGEASEDLKEDAEFRVVEVVARWSRAWQEQRPDDYLAEYSNGYAPSSGTSNDSWSQQRRERILAPGSIRVTVLDLEVDVLDSTNAVARFRQIYESDRFGDVVRKTLRVQSEAGSWKIVGEDSVAVQGAR